MGWRFQALSACGLLWLFRRRAAREQLRPSVDAHANAARHVVCAARHVVCADAVEWIRKLGDVSLSQSLRIPDAFDMARCSIVVSMPDFSETPFSEGLKAAAAERASVEAAALAAYKGWFLDTACNIFHALRPGQFALFYQSDIRVRAFGSDGKHSRETAEWLDKSTLVQLAALKFMHPSCQDGTGGAAVGGRCIVRLLSHRIYCVPAKGGHESPVPMRVATSAPAYTHLLCFSKTQCACGVPPSRARQGAREDAGTQWHFPSCACAVTGGADPWRPGLPDVAFKGNKLWVRGMDLRAVDDAMRFLSSQPSTEGTGPAVRAVLDPFCGVGSVLAGANAYGMAALGVDLSPRRCREAREMQVSWAHPGKYRQRQQKYRQRQHTANRQKQPQ